MQTNVISQRARGGFSFIEIMVTLLIIGIVVGAAVPMYNRYIERAKKDTAKSDLKLIKNVIEEYQSDVGQYPDSLEDLIRRPANESLAQNWQGEYLEKKNLTDPWKKKYKYQLTPDGEHPFELYSQGSTSKGKSGRISAWQ